MNKYLPYPILQLVVLLLSLIVPVSKAQAAASLQLTPSTLSAGLNTTVEIKVSIQTDAVAVLGSDAILSFGGNDLEVVSISNGGFFPEFGSASNVSGRIELHGYTSAINDSRTGSGTLATIVFKAKKGSGSSTVSFTCAGSGNDTNILTTSGQNILQCAQTNTTGISFTGTTVTNTVSPTPTGMSGNTPTPTAGSTGNTAPQCASLYANISAATSTPVAVTFTCSGIDTGGYINAAEFVFGDGTSQIVEKNAGSPGSIDTSHTYTTIGTVGATCRVRDNDGIWSSIPENCRKNISIKPKPSATPVPRSYGDRGAVSSPTPTRVVVSMVSETPTPIENPLGEPTAEPTLYPDDGQGDSTLTSSNRIWWIIGGIIAILLAFLLLRRKDPPRDSQGQVPIANV